MSAGRPEAKHSGAGAVRVMVVDDSALMRKLLSQSLARDASVEVVDTASDGQFALDHMARARPDVVLLDVDMPRLDGLATLDRLVAEYRVPVVMCSTSTTAGATATIEALARGAVDFIEKPTLPDLASGAAAERIAAKVLAAAQARVAVPRGRGAAAHAEARRAAPAQPARQCEAARATIRAAEVGQLAHMAARVAPEFVAVGVSTGGPPALELLVRELPADFPLGLVIVQHMPPGFTAMLASHLDRSSALKVREAAAGDTILPGTALVAPGDAHLRVVRGGAGYSVALDASSPPVSGHRPSADVLFESAAAASRGRAIGVVMTGMGSDGADGLGRMFEAGALTIAQSPETCVCQGMPKSAIERGHARAVLPLEEIAPALAACGRAAARRAGQ